MSSVDYVYDADYELINQSINQSINEGECWMVSGVLGGSMQQKRSDPIFDR